MKTFYCEKDGKLSENMQAFYKNLATYGKIMSLIRKKDVKVNGARVSKDGRVSVGDKIEVYYDGEDKRTLTEIYKDEDVLAAYKPSGVTSEDFFDYVKSVYPSAEFIHRLDRNTDGIMIFALGKSAEEELLKGFKQRTFDKYYLAEVYGVPAPDAAVLTGYLKKDPEKAEVRVYRDKTAGAVEIKTAYKVLKKSGATSVLEVKLITGKTHQIRAHLASVGHFILGDGKYGKESVNRKYGFKSQRLTAYRLVLNFDGGKLGRLDGKEIIYTPALAAYGIK